MDVETLQNRVYESVPRPRRRRKRSAWRKTIWPLIKLSTMVVLAFLVVNTAVSRIGRPIRLLGSEYRETQQVAGELAALKEDNAALERRIKHLQSSRGAEQAARKLGYVKPGEITVVIPE